MNHAPVLSPFNRGPIKMNRSVLILAFVVVFVIGTAVACSGTRVRSGEVGVRVVDLGIHAGG